MDIDNQTAYWDRVAEVKTFTHPLNRSVLDTYLTPDSKILDYGCGYGRVVNELKNHLGYRHVTGYDTSKELIERGRRQGLLPIHHIETPSGLPVAEGSQDCIILFAVLTCIPSNEGQKSLLRFLSSKLKPNGIVYISDYYLQDNSGEVEQYEYLNGDKANFGVFHLPEGATFRHHTREWIEELLNDFRIEQEQAVEVFTMNGQPARAFQLVARK